MSRPAPLRVSLALVLALAPAVGSAWPVQWLAEARGGVANTGYRGVTLGPSAGLSAEVTLIRELALEVWVEQSWHRFQSGNQSLAGVYDSGCLAAQYRLDVAGGVPYASLGLAYTRFRIGAAYVDRPLGVLGLGLHVPFGRFWVATAEAQYRVILSNGQFASGASLQLGVGYRSRDF